MTPDAPQTPARAQTPDVPQTPDPYAHVRPQAVATVRAAAALAAKDIAFHTSIDAAFGAAAGAAGQRLLALANRLLAPAAPEPLEPGAQAAASTALWKKVADALDVFFDKADVAMDAVLRPGREPPLMALAAAPPPPPPADAVLEKPQVHFRVPVDNSDSGPFVPRLATKPHAATPLHACLVPVAPADACPAHYPQPYAAEIASSAYPALVYEQAPPVPPPDWRTSAATWVDTPAQLAQMVVELRLQPAIAVDLEHHDLRSYYGITCLMQISDRTRDWIVDTLALRDDLLVLNEVFADPRIVKVFHGANMDIVWLQRDLGLYVVSLFDTFFASRALGFPKLSLAYLLETFARFQTLKQYQLADWRVRPLPAVMLDYARADTHFLLHIYDQLRNRLLAAGPHKLTEVLENSRKVAGKRFEYVAFRPSRDYNSGLFSNDAVSEDTFIALNHIPAHKHELVRRLFRWRDKLARDLDESPRYVMPNKVMVSLASLAPPVSSQSVTSCFVGFSKILRDNVHLLTELVQECCSEPLPATTDSHHPRQNEPFTATPKLAAEMGELFSLLVKNAADLYAHTEHVISPLSRVFLCLPHDSAFSVQVPQDGSKPVIIAAAAIKQRLDAVASIAPVRVPHNQHQKFAEPDTELMPEIGASAETETPLLLPLQPEEEIITLLPKKNRKPLNKKKPVQDEAPFDYLAQDKKILTKEDPKIRKKKRSFEPFSKQDTDGPHPYKGRKLAPQGKTTSFTKKK